METHRTSLLVYWSIQDKLQAPNVPPPLHWSQKDRGIARPRKLISGADFERGARVQEGLFVGPPMECRREFAAANLQAESYVERKHNARWDALGVAHATSGITANVLTLRLPTAFSRATSSVLTYKVHRAKRWNNGNSGADHNVRLHKGTVHRGYADA